MVFVDFSKAFDTVGRTGLWQLLKKYGCPEKFTTRIPCNRAVHTPIRSRGLDSVQTTGEKAACLHDATSAFDHEDNLDGQSDK